MRGLLLFSALFATAAFGQAPDRKAEIQRLRKEAEAKTKQIGQLAQKGDLTTSDESVRLLQTMVDELKAIREALRRLEGEAPPPSTGSRFRWQGYAQLQYQDTNRIGPDRTTLAYDGFRFRRFRIGFVADVAPRLTARVSLDAVAGTTGTEVRSREMYFNYATGKGGELWAGQFQVPLGYEIERSSADRELPERAAYNGILFTTERSRGFEWRGSVGRWNLKGALIDSLTIGDPELGGETPGSGERVAVAAQARYVASKDASVGISGLAGARPAFTAGGVTSPRVARRFLYLDGRLGGLFGNRLTLLGEAMVGSDRVPSSTANAGATANALSGYHLIGVWRLSGFDRFAVRWEGFDPDRDELGDGLQGLGFAYIRDLTSAVKLTFGYNSYEVDSRSLRYGQDRFGQTFLRMQVRF